MNIYIDIGNTSLDVIRRDTKEILIIKFLNAELSISKFNCINFLKADNIYISSVNSTIYLKLTNYLKARNLKFSTLDYKLMNDYVKKYNYSIDNLSYLGQDLFLDIIAVEENTIVIDLGTLTKILYIDKDKKFLGGSILFGVSSIPILMSKETDLINEKTINKNPNLISLNTNEAISSGAINGMCFSICEYIKQIREKYNKNAKVVFTGGNAYLIENKIKELKLKNYFFIDNLVLHGLAKIFNTEDYETIKYI